MTHRLHMLLFAALPVVVLLAPGLARADDEKKPKEAQNVPPFRVLVQPGALGGAAPFGMADPAALLRYPKVQEELKLDADQATKVQELIEQFNTERRDLYAPLRGLGADEQKKKLAEIQPKVRQLTDKTGKALKEVLKTEQVARLDQISLQVRGIGALSDPEIADKLQLSQEQRKQIADAESELQKQRDQLLQDIRNGNVDRAKYQEKLGEINKDIETKIAAALTKEQNARLAEMKGEKFELPARAGVRNVQAIPLRINPGKIQPIPPQKIRIQIQPKAAT